MSGLGFLGRLLLVGLSLVPLLPSADTSKFQVPVTYYKLPNGLRVALSRDTTAPLAVVAVYYKIGFRVEPKDRTGFAHLFEHMMFQGSRNLGKMEMIRLVESNGGVLNGSTRLDFTNYFEVFPSHKLETFLWAEADRMKGLAIDQSNLTNQQGVVSNEVKVNVLNQPYGGFPWLDMPQYANKNWYNAHNFYGDLKDIDAATLDDVKAFFTRYYAPNNAALAVVGDFDEAQVRQWVEKYFGGIASQPQSALPDLSEPLQEKEQRFTKTDKLAKKPALGIAYHMPERGTPEHYAMVLLDQILVQGDDSLLNQELVKRRGFTDSVDGGINLLGNAFNYSGPMIWIANLIHDSTVKPDEILAAVDKIVGQVQSEPPSPAAVDRALVKFRSRFYSELTQFGGVGRADYLASLALFDDNPGMINEIEPKLREVTPAMIQRVAKEYLRAANRTTLTIEPGAAEAKSQ
jgi:predicted Zn-dependent peptidase